MSNNKKKGSIRKRGNKYHITIDIGIDKKTGKRRRHYESFNTEEEAKAQLALIAEQVEKGTFISETDMNIDEFLDKWLELTKKNLRVNTYYVYEKYLRIIKQFLPRIKAKDLCKMGAEEILTALLRVYALSTVRYCRRILSTAFARGVEWELISRNPFAGIKLAVPTRKYTIWTPEQVDKFLAASVDSCVKHRGNWSYFVAYSLALRAGMRKSEILGLRWKNVDLEHNAIHVVESRHPNHGKGGYIMQQPKSKAGMRKIIIDDDLVDILADHYERQDGAADFVVTTEAGNPVHPRNLTAAMQRIIERTDLPRIRFHDMRHTHASLLLLSKVAPKVVQERLGHAKVETTMSTYAHVYPSQQEEAANIMQDMLKFKPDPSSTKRSADEQASD